MVSVLKYLKQNPLCKTTKVELPLFLSVLATFPVTETQYRQSQLKGKEVEIGSRFQEIHPTAEPSWAQWSKDD